VLIIGIVGAVLFFISLTIILSAILYAIKGRSSIKKFVISLIFFLITLAFGTSFIYLSLLLQTFSRYTYEEKIGWVYAEKAKKKMSVTFLHEKNNRLHWCNLEGDQWMIEGHILRWSQFFRWLGVGSYYEVTRFSGRWEKPNDKKTTIHEIHPEGRLWKLFLKYGEKIPFVDAAYGIGAFQYPRQDTFYVYINDTGFILRTR